MSENPDNEERPCLHCMIMDLLEDFFAEYPAPRGEPDTIDTNEVITALAKTVAETNLQPEWCEPAANNRKTDARNYG
jgi:hypothetical protein